MIHVDRARVDVPAILESKRVREDFERASHFFALAREQRSQKRFDFRNDIYESAEVQNALKRLFEGKCGYCESSFKLYSPLIVDHFRPKYRAINSNGALELDHYWWLVYEWRNLYLSCAQCSRLKANRFPVKGRRIPIQTPYEELYSEQNLLLDPCIDVPSEHLIYTSEGRAVSETERGRVSIEVLGLNRSDLVESRFSVLRSMRRKFEQIQRKMDGIDLHHMDQDVVREIREIRAFVRNSSDYAGMCRQFAYNWLHENNLIDTIPGQYLLSQMAGSMRLITKSKQDETSSNYLYQQEMKELYSVEDNITTQKEAYYVSAKRIERLEIRNFKSIKDLDLRFPEPKSENESWLMLIGENATGKSSILQAIALTLMGEEKSNELGLDASKFVRRNARQTEGFVRIYMTGFSAPFEMKFRRDSRLFENNQKEPKILLLGYGATRLLPPDSQEPDEGTSKIKVRNLFFPTIPLSDANAWLLNRKQVNNRQFNEIAETLRDLLMIDNDGNFTRSHDKVEINLFGNRTSLREMSDGYQSVVALSIDIMSSLYEKWQNMQNAEGLILLDEIEVHLHPSWKIQIVERLRNAFPRMMFVTTTHDPLCLRGLHPNEIVMLSRNSKAGVVAETNNIPVDELRADQILTSPLFGLYATRGKSATIMIERYSQLLSKVELTGDETEELASLRDKLSGIITESENPVSRKIEQAVRKSLLDIQVEDQDTEVADHDVPVDLMLEIRKQLRDIIGGEGD